MKIIKYIKTGKNKYKVELINGDVLVLYEDIILKYELLLKKEIDDIELIVKENEKYKLYDKVLNLLSKRIRCESEIRTYLKKYTSDQEYINNIISKLYENKLLDNKLYIKSFIHDKINFTNDGPIKIKKNLEDTGIDSFEIDDLLDIFNNKLQIEKISNYVNKNLKVNKKSLYAFKQKMLINLINLGYYKDDIVSVLDKIKLNEESLREKEKEKIRKKYSKKYDGVELERVIKRKLYEKGFKE